MTKNKLIQSGSRVTVLGLGVSGRSAARYALNCGAEVAVSELRPAAQFTEEERDFLSGTGVEWEAGGHTLHFLAKSDVVLVSPGVDLRKPLFGQLREKGVQVCGELAAVANQFGVPVIAITGTNGKTTVTTFLGEALSGMGKRVYVGGNIGTPLYDYFRNAQEFDLIVAELSSFQLENLGDFRPNVGVLLNISPDHLDRHTSMKSYVAAKMQLFKNQIETDVAVVNGDDPYCQNLDPDFLSRIESFGQGNYNDLIIKDGKFVVDKVGRDDEYLLPVDGSFAGFHAQNYGAAVLALRAVGCTPGEISRGLRNFNRPPHRLEFVAEINGVRFFDDSKATNTGAVLGALQSFDCPVILIAGGRDKGDDFQLLAESVRRRVKKLILLGEAAGLLERALAGMTETLRVADMDEAVAVAADAASPGDVVLLSPACASFDMFRSYGHRGEVFSQAVKLYARL